MKTLKYLMLLLAVALALPAMAQEMEKSAGKKIEAVFDAQLLDKKAYDTKDKIDTISNETTGTFGNITYNVTTRNNGKELVATATTKSEKVTLTLVKTTDGSIIECSGMKSACPANTTYVEDKPIDIGPVLKEPIGGWAR